MKIRYIYTVVREFSTTKKELKEEINSFRGVEDEAGEYLYGGSCGNETIQVKMQVFDNDKWTDVKRQ